MTKPTVPAINASPLREQARDWFVRRHGGMDAAAEAAFQLWLAADAAHPQAYAQWETTSAEVGRMPEEVRALLRRNLAYDQAMDAASARHAGRYTQAAAPDARPTAAIPGRRRALVLGAYATLALTSGGLLWRHLQAQPVFAQSFETARGEQSDVPLPDGTALRLDTATRVEVAYYRDRRELRLAAGQVLLAVQKDAGRPFRVAAGPVKVTVVGTRFSVRHTPQQQGDPDVEVAVSQGRVRVEGMAADGQARGSAVYLGPGQQVSAGADGALGDVAPVSQEQVGAWRHYQLRFLNRRLDQVLAELSRYGAWPLVIRDPQVAALQLTGVFDPRDALTFQRVLPLSLPVRLVDAGGGRKEVVMRR